MRKLSQYCEAQGHKASMDQDSKPGSLIPETVLLAVTHTASLRLIKTRVEVTREFWKGTLQIEEWLSVWGQGVDTEEKKANSHLV